MCTGAQWREAFPNTKWIDQQLDYQVQADYAQAEIRCLETFIYLINANHFHDEQDTFLHSAQ